MNHFVSQQLVNEQDCCDFYSLKSVVVSFEMLLKFIITCLSDGLILQTSLSKIGHLNTVCTVPRIEFFHHYSLFHEISLANQWLWMNYKAKNIDKFIGTKQIYTYHYPLVPFNVILQEKNV